MSTANAISAIPMIVYGNFTDDASCTRYACTALVDIFCNASAELAFAFKINKPPRYGPMVVPSELKACVKFNRLDAVSGGPKTETYALAATCSAVIPAASTISAPKNNGNDGALAAGINRNAPTPMVTSPVTIVLL